MTIAVDLGRKATKQTKNLNLDYVMREEKENILTGDFNKDLFNV